MLKAFRPLLLLTLVAACAARPPEPPTPAQIASPHRVLLDEPRPSVPVDANLDLNRVVAVPLSPLGLIVAAAVMAGDAAVNSITEANRTSRRDELIARMGPTGPVSGDFASRFDAELRRQLAEVPTLRVERFDQAPRGAQVALGEGTSLRLYRDMLLTTDGRFLVARATTVHTVGEGATRRSIVRHVVVFSDPVDAASEEEAIARWTADDGRLMREQARPLAAELASVTRLAVFSTEALDTERMTRLQLATSGVSILLGTRSDGQDAAFWAQRNAAGFMVRQDASRTVVLAALGREGNRWTWISVPTGLLPASRPS